MCLHPVTGLTGHSRQINKIDRNAVKIFYGAVCSQRFAVKDQRLLVISLPESGFSLSVKLCGLQVGV